MKLGLHLNDYTWHGGSTRLGANLANIVRTADECGFDSIGVADHVWRTPFMGGPEGDMLECHAVLAFIAAHTSHTKLLTLVTAVSFRHPGLLAKTVTTLDVLSGGRAWLGIGAGRFEDEARGLGLPFPPLSERFEMLEEALQVCRRLWDGESGDERPFEGRHYQLQRPLNQPQSLSRPHPPILIAGGGERKTLRLVARYANACNLHPGPEIPRKLDALRRHCDAEGRNYEAIEKTCMFNLDVGEDGSGTGELIEQLRSLAGMGIQTVFGSVSHADRIAPLKAIGREVIPAVANL